MNFRFFVITYYCMLLLATTSITYFVKTTQATVSTMISVFNDFMFMILADLPLQLAMSIVDCDFLT